MKAVVYRRHGKKDDDGSAVYRGGNDGIRVGMGRRVNDAEHQIRDAQRSADDMCHHVEYFFALRIVGQLSVFEFGSFHKAPFLSGLLDIVLKTTYSIYDIPRLVNRKNVEKLENRGNRG